MTCPRDARIPLQSHTGTSRPGQKDTRQVNELRRKSQTPSSAPPDAQPEQPQGEPAPHPVASLHVFPRDPFKELAELRVRKRPRAMAWGPAGQDPFRRRPDAFKPATRKSDAPHSAAGQPASVPPPHEPKAAAPLPPLPPEARSAAAHPPLLLIPPGEVFLDKDADLAPAAPAPARTAPAMASASAVAPASSPTPSAKPETTTRRDYYGRGGSGGSGGGEPPKPKRFDQDDIAAAIMALLLLLAIGWGAMSLMGDRGGATDDRRLLPQSAASDPEPAPAPAPDPYAGAPVDLTPRSVMPAVPSEDPSPVPEAVSPQTALAAAPQPDTAAAPGTAPTCDPTRVVRAYFCTAKADLTPQSRAALESQLKEMGSCTDGREWVVRGFTDTRGAETFNTELAARRAASVASVLRSSGLTVTEVVGVGKLTDMEQGQNCANQRRVDVSLKTSLPPSNRACAPLPEDEALICP